MGGVPNGNLAVLASAGYLTSKQCVLLVVWEVKGEGGGGRWGVGAVHVGHGEQLLE